MKFCVAVEQSTTFNPLSPKISQVVGLSNDIVFRKVLRVLGWKRQGGVNGTGVGIDANHSSINMGTAVAALSALLVRISTFETFM